jgi:hypothetical protein
MSFSDKGCCTFLIYGDEERVLPAAFINGERFRLDSTYSLNTSIILSSNPTKVVEKVKFEVVIPHPTHLHDVKFVLIKDIPMKQKKNN